MAKQIGCTAAVRRRRDVAFLLDVTSPTPVGTCTLMRHPTRVLPRWTIPPLHNGAVPVGQGALLRPPLPGGGRRGDLTHREDGAHPPWLPAASILLLGEWE